MAYLQGILSDTSRKNGWQLAEYAQEARPDGMQRLLGSAVWGMDGVRDDLRSYTLEHLGQESAILVIDETSSPKRGRKWAGWACSIVDRRARGGTGSGAPLQML